MLRPPLTTGKITGRHPRLLLLHGLGLGLLLALGLLTLPAQSHAETITYTYDSCPNGKGQLCSATNVVGSTTLSATTFAYDSMGRISQTTKTIDGIAYSTGTSYDSAGRVQSVSYPDNDTVYYGYTGTTLATVAQDAGATVRYATYAGYNALGQPGSVAYGNGVTTTYTYAFALNSDTNCRQENYRLCAITTSGSGGTYQSLRYTYDGGAPGVGNITTITDGLATSGMHTKQTQNFVYDDLYRLTKATGPYTATGTSLTITYVYDTIGNLTCNSQLSACTATTPNYKYLDPAHAHAVTAVTNAAGRAYAYDPNGNMTQRGTDALTYDGQNRLVADLVAGTTLTSFVYDGDGGRIKKSTGSTTTVYIGKLYECVGAGACTKHIFAGAVRIASKPVSSTEISYYHTDHLGSTSVVTDKLGVKVAEYVYRPYGETSLVSPAVDPGPHYKYTGQEKDSETSLYFYNARYYDPALGRFIQADTIVPGGDAQAFNRYAYAANNPINVIDPSGHWPHLHRLLHRVKNGFRSFEHAIGWYSGYSEMKWAYQHPQQALQYATMAAGVVLAVGGCPMCAAWVLPTIMAVGSGAQVALAGGSFTDIVAGAAVGVIVGEAAGMLGAPVNTALGGYTGAFAGGAVAGFTQGMATAELYGGNAIRAGYQGAIVGAAMGVAVHALQQSFSPTPQTTDSTRIGVDQSRSDQPVTLVSGQNLEPTIYHGYDPGTGLYSITFHALPGFTPGTAVSANIEYMVYGSTSWESFYTQGMPVPGVWNGDFVTFSFQPVKGTNLGPEYGGSITNYLVTPTGGPSVSFSAENP